MGPGAWTVRISRNPSVRTSRAAVVTNSGTGPAITITLSSGTALWATAMMDGGMMDVMTITNAASGVGSVNGVTNPVTVTFFGTQMM